MVLTRQKLTLLLETLVLTRDDEVDCDDCFKYLAEFAEMKLADRSVPEALTAIDRHLAMCGDCAEEFKLFKQCLVAVDDDFVTPTRD